MAIAQHIATELVVLAKAAIFVIAATMGMGVVAVDNVDSAHSLDLIRHRTTRFSSLLLALVLSLVLTKAEATDVATFLKDYRGVVKQRLAQRTSVEVEGMLVEERIQNSNVAFPKHLAQEIIYTRNPTHEKLQSHFTERADAPESLGQINVTIQGTERNFWLQRPISGGDWAITMMETDTATAKDTIRPKRTFIIDAWSHLGGYSVAKLLDSPDFRIDRVEPKGDLIGVDFSFRPEDPKKALIAGHFVVDPTQGMAIRRQDVRRWASIKPDKIGTIRSEASYRMVDGIALPEEVDLRIDGPTPPIGEYTHFHATRVSTATVPDSAFTLAAFGLGDLERPAPRSRFDFAYWAVGLAGVAFALSLFLRWRGRNSAQSGDRPVGATA